MRQQPSWRAVAHALAERMSHHDRCDQHPEAQAAPDCPWCKDRAAYRLWQSKSGQTFVQREAPGEVVDVFAHYAGHPSAASRRLIEGTQR